MSIYDLKYMNPDRRLNNWFIRKNKKTGQLDLYPMFDNEMILGFDNDLNDGKLSEETLEKEDYIDEVSLQGNKCTGCVIYTNNKAATYITCENEYTTKTDVDFKNICHLN